MNSAHRGNNLSQGEKRTAGCIQIDQHTIPYCWCGHDMFALLTIFSPVSWFVIRLLFFLSTVSFFVLNWTTVWVFSISKYSKKNRKNGALLLLQRRRQWILFRLCAIDSNWIRLISGWKLAFRGPPGVKARFIHHQILYYKTFRVIV